MSGRAAALGSGKRLAESGSKLLRRSAILACLLLLLVAHRTTSGLAATATSPLVPLARLFDLTFLGMALLLAHAAGARVLRALGLVSAPVEGVAYATPLGLGLGAYAALALGLLGLYRAPVLLVGLIGTALFLRRDLAKSWAAVLACGQRVLHAPPRMARGVPTLVVLLAGAVLLTTLAALTPPHHWDPLTYHLAAPQRFLATGRIEPLAAIEWSNLPLTVELLYGVGLAFGSETFGQLLHLAFAGLTAAALWALARRRCDVLTGWLALAVFLSTPLVLLWARVADIDLGLSCFLLLSVAAALRADDVEDRAARSTARRWLLVAGVFAGLALGSKYQALPAVLPLGLLILVGARRRGGARATLADAAIFGMAAAAVAAPWYVKNGLLLGNPVWPLFFGGRGISGSALDLTNYYVQSMVLSPRTPLGYLALPLRAYTRGDFEQPFVILSPLYLLTPALVALPRRRELVYLLTVSAGFAAGWALGSQGLRYLLPACAPLSLATAHVLRAACVQARLRPLVISALCLSTLLTLTVLGLYVIGFDRPVGVLLGRESRDTYLQRSRLYGAFYRASSVLRARLEPGEQVAFFDEARLYYWPATVAVRTDHLNVNLILLSEAHPDPTDALAALRAEGVDYLLINERNIRWTRQFDPDGRLARGQATFERLAPLLEPVYRDGDPEEPDIVIYRVPPAGGIAAREDVWSR